MVKATHRMKFTEVMGLRASSRKRTAFRQEDRKCNVSWTLGAHEGGQTQGLSLNQKYVDLHGPWMHFRGIRVSSERKGNPNAREQMRAKPLIKCSLSSFQAWSASTFYLTVEPGIISSGCECQGVISALCGSVFDDTTGPEWQPDSWTGGVWKGKS